MRQCRQKQSEVMKLRGVSMEFKMLSAVIGYTLTKKGAVITAEIDPFQISTLFFKPVFVSMRRACPVVSAVLFY